MCNSVAGRAREFCFFRKATLVIKREAALQILNPNSVDVGKCQCRRKLSSSSTMSSHHTPGSRLR